MFRHQRSDDGEPHLTNNPYDDRDDKDPEWTVDEAFSFNTGVDQ